MMTPATPPSPTRVPLRRALLAALYAAVYRLGAGRHDGGLTILTYHSLDDHPTGISVPPRLFAAQMAALAAEGCTALTMAEVAAVLAAGRPFRPRAVAITFDDGFANLATAGAAVLARHGFPATVYMIAGMIGRTTQWTDHGRPLPAEPLLAWPAIQALANQGIEIGAHTVTHGFLSTYALNALIHELTDGRAMLEARLERPVTAFAYPQGDYTPRVVRATRAAGYTTAVTMDQGRAGQASDPWRLPRLYVGRNTSPATMRAFVVPTIGPTYRLLNLIIRRLPGHARWPCPAPGTIQSTETVSGPAAP